MNPNTRTDLGDAVSWLGAVNTALGTLTVMLFPLALPIIILTVAFVVPLLLLAIPLAIPVGVVLLIRRIARSLSARAARAPERYSQGRSGSWRAAPGPQAH
jgi:hypothetical protein